MKNNLNKTTTTTKAFTTILSLMILALPFLVFGEGTATTIKNPLAVDSIPEFVTLVLGYVVKVGGVAAICAFIWAGYLFVMAQGNTTKLEEARKVFVNTCIGVALLLGAQLIASIIVNTLNSLSTR